MAFKETDPIYRSRRSKPSVRRTRFASLCFAFITLALGVIGLAAYSDFREEIAQKAESGQIKLIKGRVGSDGIPTGPAQICLTGKSSSCFSPPVETPPYGLHAQVRPIDTHNGKLFLFTAESWAGAKVSFTFVSLLQAKNQKLVNIVPDILVSDEGEYAAWQQGSTEMPFLVVAECNFDDAGDDLSHGYEITSYRFDEQNGRYKQVDRYLTSHRFKSGVLISEKASILAHLANSERSQTIVTSMGDSLSTALHPAPLPFPGLPDLSKPVYLKKMALICESSGSLFGVSRLLSGDNETQLNQQHVEWALKNFHCAIAHEDVLVSVLLPQANDQLEYTRERDAHVVRVRWKNSDGSTDVAWSFFEGLRN